MHADSGEKVVYGIDAPSVLRNYFVLGGLLLGLGLVSRRKLRLGKAVLPLRASLLASGTLLLAEGSLYLLYETAGKMLHRDRMLDLHAWKGDEQVLDVGCGRGLLLAGAAKRLTESRGSATGIDIWSTEDLKGNSEDATWSNLRAEGISERCTLISTPAQDLPFPNASFDVVLSNLCLHNIKEGAVRRRAVRQIARVLRPGGITLISDYKHTSEYAEELREEGLVVERLWANPLYTFPPLRVVVGRKP